MESNDCVLFGSNSKATDVTAAEVQVHAATGCTKCLLLREIAARINEPNVTFDAVRARHYGWRRVSYRYSLGEHRSIRNNIEVLVAKDSPKLFPELQHPLLVGDNPSKESLSYAKTWISQCTAKHRSCQNLSDNPLPKRVVDVSGTTVRLVETATDQCGQYITLSHCWGEGPKPKCLTTRSTREENMREIQWDSLPLTFRDTIEVTRELGIQYLWIDSLCILQDDAADWKEESAKMALIYENSYLTICATAAKNGDAGLWQRKPPMQEAEKVVVEHAYKQYEVYVKKEDFGHERAIHLVWGLPVDTWPLVKNICPLMSRGWALQERLLAPRLLHYGHGEMLWECPEQASCECCFSVPRGSKYMSSGQYSTTNLVRRMQRSNNREEIANHWRDLVCRYSELDLTLSKDKLPAISGLAKAFLSVRHGDVYLAGLWKDTIIEDLCWQVTPALPMLPRPERHAPTWSWASLSQKAIYLRIDEYDRIYARVVQASTVLAGPDPTGEVISGSVVLVAPVKSARVTKLSAYLFHVAADSLEFMCVGDSETDFDPGWVRVGTTVSCVRVKAMYQGRQDWMLILVAVENGKPDVYRRIGHAKVFTDEMDRHWFKNENHVREVEII